MVLDLYDRLPAVRITDLLQEVDEEIGLTEAFTHLRTGVPCRDRIGLLNVLLAEGLNLGLSKMAEATNSHDYFQLHCQNLLTMPSSKHSSKPSRQSCYGKLHGRPGETLKSQSSITLADSIIRGEGIPR